MENSIRYEAPSLQDLCLKVFQKDLISKATPSTVEYVRDGIDCWQTVIKGRGGEKDFRDQCLENLNKSFFTDVLKGAKKKKRIPLHVCAVLDCLLSDNLTVLELRLPYKYIKSFASLMTVIARRSPKLKELVIKYFNISSLSEEPLIDWKPTKKMKGPSNSCISLLHDLTNLSLIYKESGSIFPPLRFADDPSSQSILSTVGERCPSLEKLLVSGFRYRKQDLIGLILGEVVNVLFPLENKGWSKDSVLGSLRIPLEFMRPLCFTLQELRVFCNCHDLTECTHRSYSPAAYAFILRHLVNLHSVMFLRFRCFPTSIFLKLLAVLKKERVEFQQAKFEEACLAATATYVGLERNLTGPLSYVSGSPLPLRFLHGVPIDDLGEILDFGPVFPNATEVSFVENLFDSRRIHLSSHPSSAEYSSLFNDEIGAILRQCWPNVESIDLVDIGCRACLKIILNAFGPQLKRIQFIGCSELDLFDLIPFTILESLSIGVDCSIVTNAAESLNMDSLICLPFLPALKKFTSYSCLGNWSPLFESKSSFTKLRLNCSHIGTGELPRLEWAQIPELWKTVKTLEIGSCSGLTLTELAELFSELPSLKNARMPYSITENETEVHIEEVLQRLLDSKKSVEFDTDFAVGYYWTECDFQGV